MKKIIALLLALTLCLGLFVGCAGEEKGPTLDDAVEFLVASNNLDEGKKTAADYKLAAQITVEGVVFEVEWAADLDSLTLTKDGKFYVVDVPSKNETEVQYILTATIKDAEGNTATKQFTRILPVYDDGAAVTAPEEGVAYKMFFNQLSLGKTLYCINQASNNKYIKTDIDPKKGADFYAEKVDGGYKFYTEIDGAKMYLHASTTMSDEGKVSKYLSYVAESDVVFYYKTEVKTWMVTIDNIEYGIGTYGTFDTMSLSDGSYFTTDKVGVDQFVMTLITKEAAEQLAPTEGPADPTELTSIADFTAIAEALEDKTGTVEKYLVKGVVTEIKSETYGNMYIQDEAGNQLYIYGVYSKDGSTRYDALETKPQVGDTITLMGIAKNYGGAQMENGWIQELVAGEGGDNAGDNAGDNTTKPSTDPAANSTLTIAEAIALGESKEHDTYTEGKYYVSGVITEVYNTQYGNMKIKDSKGNILTIYGTHDAKGENRYDAMTTKPVAGDTVKIYGIIGQYNGTAQIKNGWIVEHKAASSSSGGTSSGGTSSGGTSSGGTSSGGSSSTTTTLSTSKNYYLVAQKVSGAIYFNGTISNGRINAASANSSAATVKLEKAADGEYYIYFTAGTTKTYIGTDSSASSKTAAFVLKTTKDDSCVWLIDESAKTIISKSFANRMIAIQDESSYDNFSTYASSNLGEQTTNNAGKYVAAWFVEASSAQAGPADTGASSGSSSSGGSSSGGTSSGGTSSGSEATYVTAPQTGKAYKLGMWQSSKSANYYFTGEMSGYYGATETDKSLAVDVYLEDAGNGAYYIYFMSGTTKNYIYGEASGTFLNFKFGTTKSAFTWNAEYNTFTTMIGETEVFMGTYSYYVTFGMSKVEHLSSSYVAHLYE